MMRTAFLIMVLVFAMTLSYPNAQPTDPEGCKNAFRNTTEGCRQYLHDIFHFHFSFGGLKKACCGTVINVTDLCWPILFPNEPYVRFLLKSLCTKSNLH
ncbi:hypothetical protein HID58_015443 [Brassica napus]|uniref:Prolamin-like domain-containing protein n=1 Tax=Brassica napus TaxID=3708 RepID=A0ABQ8DK17_BRANA|nr:hypothetical protein HID58_015443 [Brassica napus]